LKTIEADPRFADMFEENPDFVDSLFGGISYKQFLENGFKSENGYDS